MTTQSTIDYSNPELQAMARSHQKETEQLARILLLPNGYRVGFACIHGARGARTWELNIFHCDKSGEIDFDTPIAQGTLSQVETALRTLIAARKAYRRTIDHQCTTPVEQPDPKAKDWHSRFEHVPRPDLVSEHTPGWCDEDAGDPVVASRFIFRSHNDEFGLDFDVMENNPGGVSIGLLPSSWDWNVETSEELLELSDHTGRLQEWLNDCATVTAWIRKHESEADHE